MRTEEDDIVDWIAHMDLMLDDDQYEFAQHTIRSIRDWANEKGSITEGQKNALANIEASVDSL